MKRFIGRILGADPNHDVSVDASIELPAEVRLMDDTEESDIFFAGYPKSGNTWCQSLVCAMRYGLDIRNTPETIVQTLIPDVHFCRQYTRFQSPTCFKTHHLPKAQYRRVVYLLRDGRDAMTSYYHYIRDREGQAGNDWDSIISHGADIFPSHWHEHVQAWVNNPYGAEMLTIRYEDLKYDTVSVLREIADFVGISIENGRLTEIAEMTSFSQMRDREQRFGWAHPFPKDKKFIRRGQIGSYKDEMPPDVLKQFEIMAGTTLREMGYDTPALREGT